MPDRGRVIRRRRTVLTTAIVVIALSAAVLIVVFLPEQQRPGLPEGDQADLSASISQFVQAQPQDSGYRAPTQTERGTVADGVRRILDGRPEAAVDVLAQVGYSVRRHSDSATKRSFFEVYDTTNEPRGWGRVLVDTGAKVQLAVEVPHPRADLDSELLGVELFRKVAGSVLVVAGAHRKAAPDKRADMAHTDDSVFEAVHEVLVARKLPVMQLHGFANSSAPDNDLVVSSGPNLHGPLADRVADRLESGGFTVCRPWVTRCPGLEATTNAQALWAAAHGGEFVHVEVSRDNRDSEEDRDRVVSALAMGVTNQ